MATFVNMNSSQAHMLIPARPCHAGRTVPGGFFADYRGIEAENTFARNARGRVPDGARQPAFQWRRRQ